MSLIFFLGNPLGRSCLALAQQIERGYEMKLDKVAQNHVLRSALLVHIKSLRVVFPAACGEFVIPAEAGIQKTGLDSASSAE